MEEEKAAAYYEELTRKGEGAARFKQGLGFSTSDAVSNSPKKESAVSSSSSFYTSFVKASSPTTATKHDKEAQLRSVQRKLKRRNGNLDSEMEKLSRASRGREFRDSSRTRREKSRSRSRSRERKYRDSERRSDRNGRNSVSPPMGRRPVRTNQDYDKTRSMGRNGKDLYRDTRKQTKVGTDYSKLITGYDNMTPVQRVQARMKLQLQETAEKDKTRGTGSGWERFDFDKDAPLDDDEIEAADDDTAVVKRIGQSFRFASLEEKREEQIKAAHEEAIFGAPSALNSADPTVVIEVDDGDNETESKPNLLSEKVLQQRGSWRDRARRL